MASYTHTSDDGHVDFVITEDGLSSILLDDDEIASGGLWVRNAAAQLSLAEPARPVTPDTPPTELLTNSKSLSAISSFYTSTVDGLVASKVVTKYTLEDVVTRVVVEHTYTAEIVVEQEYVFDDEDVTVTFKISNPTDDYLSVPSLGGLTFTFDRIPDGIFGSGESASTHGLGPINNGSNDYQDLEVGYRGNRNQHYISGNYATCESYGVSVTPWKTVPLRQALLFSSYQTGQIDSETKKTLEYNRQQQVRPHGRQSFALKIRVSPDTDWQHLMTPYKEHMLDVHGELHYENDNHWKMFLEAQTGGERGQLSANNPYAYKVSSRLDTVEGMTQYASQFGLQASINLSTVIFWSIEGRHPREGTYRMDSDIIPPETLTQFNNVLLPALVDPNRNPVLNARWGVNTNFRNFNTVVDHTIREVLTTSSTTQSQQPMRFYLMKAAISSGTLTPSGQGAFLDSTFDEYQSPRITITNDGGAAWVGTVSLQYKHTTTGVWTTLASYTSNTVNTSFTVPSDGKNTAWRFQGSSWSSGTAYCRLHTTYPISTALNNTFNFIISRAESSFDGTVLLQRQSYDESTWATFTSFVGKKFTAGGLSVEFATPADYATFATQVYVHHRVNKGGVGKLVLEYSTDASEPYSWTQSSELINRTSPASGDSFATVKVTINPGTPRTRWRIRSINQVSNPNWQNATSGGPAMWAMIGCWNNDTDEQTLMKLDATQYRVRTDSDFSGTCTVAMWDENKSDLINVPTQLTRSVLNPDFDSHLTMYRRRLDNYFERGMTAFYTDTVGRYYDCFLWMRTLRLLYGNNWQMFLEYFTDHTMPYFGVYNTSTFLSRCPLGTRSTRSFTAAGQTFTPPYPVFISPLFYVKLTGSISVGSIILQKGDGTSWTDVHSYVGADLPVADEYDSLDSYADNLQWRLISSTPFSGTVTGSLTDNAMRNSSGTYDSATGLCGYNVNDAFGSYTISSVANMPTPTPYFRASKGPVVIQLSGTPGPNAVVSLERYTSSGWEVFATHTSASGTQLFQVNLTADQNWRYTVSGTWTSGASVTLVMGQWRTEFPQFMTQLMRFVFGNKVEFACKPGSTIPSSLATLFYTYAFSQRFLPGFIGSRYTEAMTVQNNGLYVVASGENNGRRVEDLT